MKGMKWCPTGPEAIAVWLGQPDIVPSWQSCTCSVEGAGVILDLGVTEGTEFNYAFKQITIGGFR